MPRLPDGDPAPPTGELPPEALASLAGSRLGMYVHVPFCAVRCGYCDFNTYTLSELGPGASTATFVDSALTELDVATRVLGPGAGPVDTVFVGGGTPTLLPAADLVRCVTGIRERFGLAPDAEVTTEANRRLPSAVSRPHSAHLHAQTPAQLASLWTVRRSRHRKRGLHAAARRAPCWPALEFRSGLKAGAARR